MEKPSYIQILKGKIDHYGEVEAAYEFAAEEYIKQYKIYSSQEEENSIDNINEIVSWYSGLPEGYNNVHELLFARDRLIGYFFLYTSDLGALRKAWNRSQADRENKRIRFTHQSLIDGKPMNKADLYGRLNTQKELEAEKEAEGMYYEHKENVESIKEVLSAMSQRIAHARTEWEQQKKVQ